MFSPPLLTVKGNQAEQDTVAATAITTTATATTPIMVTKDEAATPSSLCRRPIILNTHDKTTFRHSLASQYSSTSASGSSHSQRYSVGSADSLGHVDPATGATMMDYNSTNNNPMRRWSAESSGSDHVSSQPPSSPTGTSFSSLPPSSRFLLSGATSSEAFREQELSRFYPTTTSTLRHIKALSDPFVVMPSVAAASAAAGPTNDLNNHHYKSSVTNNNKINHSTSTRSSEPIAATTTTTTTRTLVDPWCMSVKAALENAIYSNYLHKYETPSFAFARSWKRRYVVLVDRIVYVFKSSKSTNPAREHFILTDDTLVFVSEEFQKSYVVEIRKPLCKWYLRCESASQMKFWLEAMKKIVACAKLGHTGSLSAGMLANLKLTDDFRLLTLTQQPQPPPPLPPSSQQRSLSTSPRNSTLVDQQQQPHIKMTKAKHRSAIYHRAAAAEALAGITGTATTLANGSSGGGNSNETLPQPPQWWKQYYQQPQQQQQQQPSENINRRASAQVATTTTEALSQDKSLKRQSLAEIPHWQSLLPPQRPVPQSTPPPPPTPQPSLSTSSSHARQQQTILAPVSEDN
ncbi:hypothetical protein BDB00DRAFT_924816 [Zychaea mexicana]|uniref:uncharacterized protein n=1 Tax=Zychaea mexicana TaxID=64656 RepID=UPI0022FED172|nr:uncharacterized protein BDB00DRAFT_924816 [Zychaea mexicana]KAI9499035.1 hypothetical protein BDB00DRAFT_924816 [Zychaea mexicana]